MPQDRLGCMCNDLAAQVCNRAHCSAPHCPLMLGRLSSTGKGLPDTANSLTCCARRACGRGNSPGAAQCRMAWFSLAATKPDWRWDPSSNTCTAGSLVPVVALAQADDEPGHGARAGQAACSAPHALCPHCMPLQEHSACGTCLPGRHCIHAWYAGEATAAAGVRCITATSLQSPALR